MLEVARIIRLRIVNEFAEKSRNLTTCCAAVSHWRRKAQLCDVRHFCVGFLLLGLELGTSDPTIGAAMGRRYWKRSLTSPWRS